MTTTPESPATGAVKSALADDVWHRLFEFFIITTRPQRDAALADLGLSPNDAKALYSLDAETPRTMSNLAHTWKCDASTATWTINRLEKMNLAQRRADPTDRRVRHVVLTTKGATIRHQLLEKMYATPPELLALSQQQLEQLQQIVNALPSPPSHS